jgi:hypothetical protein
LRADRFDGIGFVLDGTGPAGLDFDGVRDLQTGAIDPWAEEEVARLRTYTEISPSRDGLRAFVYGDDLPPGRRKRGNVEVYDRVRFLTVTGHRLDSAPATVESRPAELLDVWRRLVAWEDQRENTPVVTLPPSLSDLEVIRRASAAANGAKFSRLWAGDWSAYPSHSEGDLALAALLGFWVGPDLHRIDTLFQQSGLMRPKWRRADYRDRTVRRALRSLVSVRGDITPSPKKKNTPTCVLYCLQTRTIRVDKSDFTSPADVAAEVVRLIPRLHGQGQTDLATERVHGLAVLLARWTRQPTITLPREKVGEWLGCSARTITTAVRALVADGVLERVAGGSWWKRRRHGLADEYVLIGNGGNDGQETTAAEAQRPALAAAAARGG